MWPFCDEFGITKFGIFSIIVLSVVSVVLVIIVTSYLD